MSELTERILSEAAFAENPGALIRLQTIAADVASLERDLMKAIIIAQEANDDCRKWAAKLAESQATIAKVREFCIAELDSPSDPDGSDAGFDNACVRVLLILNVPVSTTTEGKN